PGAFGQGDRRDRRCAGEYGQDPYVPRKKALARDARSRRKPGRDAMNRTTALEDRRELEALLPWYLNGTLSARERVAVESWLAEDEEARRLLDAMREEQEVTAAAN